MCDGENIASWREHELKCARIVPDNKIVMEMMETTIGLKVFSVSPDSPVVFMIVNCVSTQPLV